MAFDVRSALALSAGDLMASGPIRVAIVPRTTRAIVVAYIAVFNPSPMVLSISKSIHCKPRLTLEINNTHRQHQLQVRIAQAVGSRKQESLTWQ